jgi:IS605 OrfB family transposase
MQRLGRKPRESAAYRALVARIRGLIDTEVNRALNQLVARHQPRVLVVEKLDFREPGLSRRMNRLLTNCGRGAVARKLGALAERLGIEVHEVEPAYTSQTCSACGYVAKANRKGDKFACRHCGTRIHADVNGARNIAKMFEGQAADHETGEAEGRSDLRPPSSPAAQRRQKQRASSSPRQPRSITLRDLVRRFDEREPEPRAVSRPRGRAGARESAPDPRLSNPYWRRFSSLFRSSSKPGWNEASAAFAAAT